MMYQHHGGGDFLIQFPFPIYRHLDGYIIMCKQTSASLCGCFLYEIIFHSSVPPKYQILFCLLYSL